jgi:hypothetical protein
MGMNQCCSVLHFLADFGCGSQAGSGGSEIANFNYLKKNN